MWSIVKHKNAGQPTPLFNSPCESMAKGRFARSCELLKKGETFELWHDGVLVTYAQAHRVGPVPDEEPIAVEGVMP